VLTAPVVAGKRTLERFALIVTLGGTAKDALLLLKETIVEFVAALSSDTVQLVDELLPNELGEQESEVSCAGASAVSVKL
jgi:hypothetical protein